METKRVRPVLVEIKFNSIEEMQGDIILRGNKLYTCEQLKALQLQKKENSDKVFELILISLEKEKIEEGDTYFSKYGNNIDIITKDNYISESHIRAKTFNKVIARQSQISPEYISKFIEQYNDGSVEDFDIRMITMNKGYNDIADIPYQEVDIPKLTNGFVTIIEKEQISYSKENLRDAFKAGHKLGWPGYPNLDDWIQPKFEEWFEQNKKK